MSKRKRKVEASYVDISCQEVELSETPSGIVDQRHQLIEETAYQLAEQRGFHGDLELDDWLRAESQVNQSLLPSS